MTRNEELNGSRKNVYDKNNVFNRDTVQDENPINDSIKDCNKNGNMDTDDKKDRSFLLVIESKHMKSRTLE